MPVTKYILANINHILLVSPCMLCSQVTSSSLILFRSEKKNGIEDTDYVPVTTNLSLAFLRSSFAFFLRLAF